MAETPTKRTYSGLDEAFEYFNKRLFEGRLPQCVITLRQHPRSRGHFGFERFAATKSKRELRDEIGLNSKLFHQRTVPEILST